MPAGERSADEATDLLVGGERGRGFRPRLSSRWRRGLGVAGIFLLGVVAGGYAGYAWLDELPGGARDVTPLTARVRGPQALELPYPPYRLSVDVHNSGARSVTVRHAELSISGYRSYLGLNEPRAVRPGQTETIIFGVRPDCGHPRPDRPASLLLRLREYPGEVRTVRLRPSVAESQLRAGYSILCKVSPRDVVVAARTLDVRQRGDALLVELRLARDGASKANSGDLRLLDVDVEVPGLALQGQPSAGSPALPVNVEFELSVDSCRRVQRPVRDPAIVLVSLTSAKGPYLVYAHTDTELGLSLRRYVAGRCGSGASPGRG